MDWWNIDGDLLEFIEITNNGDEEVDLTGVYFRELGITYSFPDHAQIEGHQAIVLCSDSLMFTEFYNTIPFGQYTRKLSNKSENIVLADAWGNVIDQVHYSDSLPWPMEADGEGPYLELKDLDSDNSLPENWTIGNDLTKIDKFIENQNIALYPNPTSSKIHIALSGNVTHCQIMDLMGKVLQEASPSNSVFDLDLGGWLSGMYLVKVQFADGRIAFKKVVKQ